MGVPTITMLPVPRIGYYDWGDPPQRETYTVLGFALTEPEAPDAARLYHSTWMLVERADHHLTWLSLGSLVLEPAALREARDD